MILALLAMVIAPFRRRPEPCFDEQLDAPVEEPKRFLLIVGGRDVWLTDEEIRDHDGRPTQYAGLPIEPTPDEQAADLEGFKALAERRRHRPPARFERWDGLPAAALATLHAQQAAYDTRFDQAVATRIAEIRTRVCAFRLRAIRQPRRFHQLPRCATRTGSAARRTPARARPDSDDDPDLATAARAVT
jgi:hypothetical protein